MNSDSIQAAVPYDDVAARMYAKDPQLAVDMLNACLEDGAMDEFFIALRHIVMAYGLKPDITDESGSLKASLNKKFFSDENFTVNTVLEIAKTFNMHLALVPNTEQSVEA